MTKWLTDGLTLTGIAKRWTESLIKKDSLDSCAADEVNLVVRTWSDKKIIHEKASEVLGCTEGHRHPYHQGPATWVQLEEFSKKMPSPRPVSLLMKLHIVGALANKRTKPTLKLSDGRLKTLQGTRSSALAEEVGGESVIQTCGSSSVM